jgi:hypothetical protein
MNSIKKPLIFPVLHPLGEEGIFEIMIMLAIVHYKGHQIGDLFIFLYIYNSLLGTLIPSSRSLLYGGRAVP